VLASGCASYACYACGRMPRGERAGTYNTMRDSGYTRFVDLHVTAQIAARSMGCSAKT